MIVSSALGERDICDAVEPCWSGEINQMWV